MHKDQLCSAVRGRRLVTIVFDGKSRTLEPHVVYPSADDEWYFEGWQTDGYTSRPGTTPWRRYKIDDIESLTVLDETFSGVREPYNGDSDRYDDACCKL
jgi:hypothetical protein